MSAITSAYKMNERNLKKISEITHAVKERELEIVVDVNDNSTTSKSVSKSTKDVFISYSWANKQIVQKLSNILKERGFNCWIDDNNIQGGSQLFGEIEHGISDCQVFVCCCSNSYGSSVNCQRELLLATERKKLIIPSLISPCEPWPPKGQMGPLLAGKIYVDLSTEEKFEKTVDQLVTAIRQSLS